jgi:hypothetical protein
MSVTDATTTMINPANRRRDPSAQVFREMPVIAARPPETSIPTTTSPRKARHGF